MLIVIPNLECPFGKGMYLTQQIPCTTCRRASWTSESLKTSLVASQAKQESEQEHQDSIY